VPTVAERLHLDPSTISNLLTEAGRRGLIEGRRPGKVGLRITKRGRQVLEREVALKVATSRERPRNTAAE
jgi:DNA-binding MarR family transcriptional regulator